MSTILVLTDTPLDLLVRFTGWGSNRLSCNESLQLGMLPSTTPFATASLRLCVEAAGTRCRLTAYLRKNANQTTVQTTGWAECRQFCSDVCNGCRCVGHLVISAEVPDSNAPQLPLASSSPGHDLASMGEHDRVVSACTTVPISYESCHRHILVFKQKLQSFRADMLNTHIGFTVLTGMVSMHTHQQQHALPVAYESSLLEEKVAFLC